MPVVRRGIGNARQEAVGRHDTCQLRETIEAGVCRDDQQDGSRELDDHEVRTITNQRTSKLTDNGLRLRWIGDGAQGPARKLTPTKIVANTGPIHNWDGLRVRDRRRFERGYAVGYNFRAC